MNRDKLQSQNTVNMQLISRNKDEAAAKTGKQKEMLKHTQYDQLHARVVEKLETQNPVI